MVSSQHAVPVIAVGVGCLGRWRLCRYADAYRLLMQREVLRMIAIAAQEVTGACETWKLLR